MLINTRRFHLRPLTAADVTDQYLAWFRDPEVSEQITAAAGTRTLEDLAEYVRMREGRLDVIFLGIFDKTAGVHVGNVKFEPIDHAHHYAVMGILIGNPEYRGRGVAAEVLRAAGVCLKEHLQLTHIVLTVKPDREQALGAYRAAGYRIETPPHFKAVPGLVTMVSWL